MSSYREFTPEMSFSYREIAPEQVFDYVYPLKWMFEQAMPTNKWEHPLVYTTLFAFWSGQTGIFEILPQLHTNEEGNRCYYSVFFKHSTNKRFDFVLHIFVSARHTTLKVISVDVIQDGKMYENVVRTF
jgi:hypothetical protein